MWIGQIFGSNKWTIWVDTGPGEAESVYRNLEFNTEEECKAYCEKERIQVDECPYDKNVDYFANINKLQCSECLGEIGDRFSGTSLPCEGCYICEDCKRRFLYSPNDPPPLGMCYDCLNKEE
jgi:hypothetical protein